MTIDNSTAHTIGSLCHRAGQMKRKISSTTLCIDSRYGSIYCLVSLVHTSVAIALINLHTSLSNRIKQREQGILSEISCQTQRCVTIWNASKFVFRSLPWTIASDLVKYRSFQVAGTSKPNHYCAVMSLGTERRRTHICNCALFVPIGFDATWKQRKREKQWQHFYCSLFICLLASEQSRIYNEINPFRSL